MKRLAQNHLGKDGVNAAADWEVQGADDAILILRDALRDQGFDPP